jgi:aspartokinase-like uncharacterized kinase
VSLTVAKVGGSLFDLPDLRDRLRDWLRSVAGPVLLVPGGGDGADIIRRLDQTHGLGEEAAHWVALRVLTVNAHLLAGLIGGSVESPADERSLEWDRPTVGDVTSPERQRRGKLRRSLTLRAGQFVHRAEGQPTLAVLDPHAFCVADEGRAGGLPRCWDVTSDSIAARVAEVTRAELVLLKSADLPAGIGWSAAAANGLVDATFGTIVERAGLRVRWVNLRRQSPP